MSLLLSKQVVPDAVASGSILAYTLNLTVLQNTSFNTAVTDVLPDNLTYLGPGTNNPSSLPNPTVSYSPVTQLVWNLGTLTPGSYHLSYQAKVNDFVQGGTTLVNNAAAFSPQLSVPVSASAAASITANFTVKIGVYNEAGELVKEVLISQFSQPIENITLEASDVISSLNGANSSEGIYYAGHLIGTWNGTNNDNNLVSNGNYYLKVDNIDNFGVVKSTTQLVMVNRAIYKATILIYNEAGEVIRHLYAYMDDPGLSQVLSMQLSAGVIKPGYASSNGTPSQVSVILSNGATVVWDGKSDNGTFVQSGQYFVEVHTSDGQGGQATVVREISVQDANAHNGIERVVAQPNLLNTANGFISTLTSNTSMVLTLKAFIYTTAGELVTVIDGAVGSNNVKWDASKVVSGLYIAVVEERDAKNGLVSRQIQKLIVVH